MSTFTQLGDRYTVGQVIGRGGMAEVYEGTDRRLNRKVAIKVLRPDLARDPLFQERFRREAQSAAGLNHPNIVAIYDTGEDLIEDGASQVSVPYIVMEFVDGVTLRQMLTNGPRILPERALEVVAGVLAALDYSHRHGIVHRDIKPANIMINAFGDAKVMDFGIARAMSDAATSVTATSAVMGTAQYLSPEQARGEVVDARSDIYSTGCVLYELLVGKPPFNGDSPVSIAYQHVNEPAKAPSSIDPSIPSTLDAISLSALAKDPNARYQSAADMRSDVERAIAGMPIAARAPLTLNQDPADYATTALPIFQPGGVQIAAKPKSNSSGIKWVAITLATIVAAALLFFIGDKLFPAGASTVTVPNLKAKTVDEASAALASVGLILGEQTPQADNNVPKGEIIGQDPASGELLETGQAVNVIVSAGKDQTGVPDLVGLISIEAAKIELEKAQLVLGRVTPIESDKPSGTVLDQDIAANTTVEIGTLVSISVSNGKAPVPNVVGLSEIDATNALLNAGFLVQVLVQENAAVAPGTVLSQTPAANELALEGTTVSITIAGAPGLIICPNGTTVPANQTCPVVVPTPTPTPTP
ncbi:MAG: Stk1 family PASTA domain-containing Ser/Thr kinase, partial [Candidatus Nanopelagicales bacterium]|nr:Stk1 family PASTA domain-containing Ser/Thr kinase [Candidatus Nanopelagicales bacterium]MDP5050377.1 Stk1 family PASTA domain-containing Ser/Thr kinase [Candidatus Nanopelagicales bacterium]